MALERVARSNWGDIGIGSCPNKKTANQLISLGLIKLHKKQDGHNTIYQITYRGFQLLERLRWSDLLRRKP
jgi:predicted transcriptional regulator